MFIILGQKAPSDFIHIFQLTMTPDTARRTFSKNPQFVKNM